MATAPAPPDRAHPPPTAPRKATLGVRLGRQVLPAHAVPTDTPRQAVLLRRAEADVSFLKDRRRGRRAAGGEAALPASLIPREHHVVEESPTPPADRLNSRYDEAKHTWQRTVFPALHPTSRRDVIMLERWLDTMVAQIEADAQADPVALLTNVQEVYSICFFELVRQASVDCVERGRLLAKVWQAYVSLFGSLQATYAATTLQDEVAKRVDENLAEVRQQAEDEALQQFRAAFVQKTDLEKQVSLLKDTINSLESDLRDLRAQNHQLSNVLAAQRGDDPRGLQISPADSDGAEEGGDSRPASGFLAVPGTPAAAAAPAPVPRRAAPPAPIKTSADPPGPAAAAGPAPAATTTPTLTSARAAVRWKGMLAKRRVRRLKEAGTQTSELPPTPTSTTPTATVRDEMWLPHSMARLLLRKPKKPGRTHGFKWLVRIVAKILDHKMQTDSLDDGAGRQRRDLAEGLYDYFIKVYGLRPSAESHLWDFLYTLHDWYTEAAQEGSSAGREPLFGVVQLLHGILDDPRSYPQDALHFFLAALSQLTGGPLVVGESGEIVRVERDRALQVVSTLYSGLAVEVQSALVDEIRGVYMQQTEREAPVTAVLNKLVNQYLELAEKRRVCIMAVFLCHDTNLDGFLNLDEFREIIRWVRPAVDDHLMVTMYSAALFMSRTSSIDEVVFDRVMRAFGMVSWRLGSSSKALSFLTHREREHSTLKKLWEKCRPAVERIVDTIHQYKPANALEVVNELEEMSASIVSELASPTPDFGELWCGLVLLLQAARQAAQLSARVAIEQ